MTKRLTDHNFTDASKGEISWFNLLQGMDACLWLVVLFESKVFEVWIRLFYLSFAGSTARLTHSTCSSGGGELIQLTN